MPAIGDDLKLRVFNRVGHERVLRKWGQRVLLAAQDERWALNVRQEWLAVGAT